MTEKEDMCFHHDNSEKIRAKIGFEIGGCIVQRDIPCGGTPDSVLDYKTCPGFYVPIKDVTK